MDLFVLLWTGYALIMIAAAVCLAVAHLRRSRGRISHSLLAALVTGAIAPFIVRPLYIEILPPPAPTNDLFHSLGNGIAWTVHAELNTFLLSIVLTGTVFVCSLLMTQTRPTALSKSVW